MFVQPGIPTMRIPRGGLSILVDSDQPESVGENDPGVRCFWYRPMMRIENGRMRPDTDWGIHVESDCLADMAASVAGLMEQDGVVNASDIALDLCFLFGFDHEYFHHCVDSAWTGHLQRLIEIQGNLPSEAGKYREMYMNRIDDVVDNWLLVEETLANAHVVRDPTRLGGLREAFLRYGLLPDPDEWKRGPYALWDRAAFDSRAFTALSHHVWMQYLKGEADPCGIWSDIEKICHEGGNESGFAEIVDRIVDAVDPSDLDDDAHSHVLDRAGVSVPISFGGFQQGLLRRLSVPLRVHGSQSGLIRSRFGKDNPDWPYGIIEGLYMHFRIAEVGGESDDPFGDDDDEFELTP
ncbi:MAG TPA: hypothetical protein D7H94_05000 [Candidatus Poseidoniales archaeon]|nr:MAG TPA: hypothetical protein D7H94_05000 [Candidatus Poseidoniales archaeon]